MEWVPAICYALGAGIIGFGIGHAIGYDRAWADGHKRLTDHATRTADTIEQQRGLIGRLEREKCEAASSHNHELSQLCGEQIQFWMQKRPTITWEPMRQQKRPPDWREPS